MGKTKVAISRKTTGKVGNAFVTIGDRPINFGNESSINIFVRTDEKYKVVVFGFGNSGAEITADVKRRGKSVFKSPLVATIYKKGELGVAYDEFLIESEDKK